MIKRNSSNVLSIHGRNLSTKTANINSALKPSAFCDETAAKLESESYKKSLSKIQRKADKIKW